MFFQLRKKEYRKLRFEKLKGHINIVSRGEMTSGNRKFQVKVTIISRD
jgi:hypothetical protein